MSLDPPRPACLLPPARPARSTGAWGANPSLRCTDAPQLASCPALPCPAGGPHNHARHPPLQGRGGGAAGAGALLAAVGGPGADPPVDALDQVCQGGQQCHRSGLVSGCTGQRHRRPHAQAAGGRNVSHRPAPTVPAGGPALEPAGLPRIQALAALLQPSQARSPARRRLGQHPPQPGRSACCSPGLQPAPAHPGLHAGGAGEPGALTLDALHAAVQQGLGVLLAGAQPGAHQVGAARCAALRCALKAPRDRGAGRRHGAALGQCAAVSAPGVPGCQTASPR